MDIENDGDEGTSPFLETATPEPEKKEEPDAPAEPTEAPEPEGDPAPYTPSSLKVKSFGKEYEIDSAFRPFIKDEKTEKQVRELYEKAYGMEEYKRRDSEKDQMIREQYEPLVQSIQKIGQAYQANDMDAVFSLMKIPEVKILEWVAQKIQMSELPPEQKAVYSERQKAKLEAASLREANDLLVTERNSYAASQRSFELSQGLAKPEVKEFVDTWDSMYGAGAFERQVKEIGLSEFQRLNVDLSAEEAIKKAIEKVQPVVSRLKVAAPSAPASAGLPKVIPNLTGKSGSPAKQAVRTLDDIKRLAASMD